MNGIPSPPRPAHGVALELVRAAAGLADLVAAPWVAALELGHPPDTVTVAALRVLGVRQLLQALLTAHYRSGRAHAVGGVTDVLHAVSMLALALVDEPRRRGAWTQCAAASCLAIGEIRTAVRTGR